MLCVCRECAHACACASWGTESVWAASSSGKRSLLSPLLMSTGSEVHNEHLCLQALTPFLILKVFVNNSPPSCCYQHGLSLLFPAPRCGKFNLLTQGDRCEGLLMSTTSFIQDGNDPQAPAWERRSCYSPHISPSSHQDWEPAQSSKGIQASSVLTKTTLIWPCWRMTPTSRASGQPPSARPVSGPPASRQSCGCCPPPPRAPTHNSLCQKYGSFIINMQSLGGSRQGGIKHPGLFMSL